MNQILDQLCTAPDNPLQSQTPETTAVSIIPPPLSTTNSLAHAPETETQGENVVATQVSGQDAAQAEVDLWPESFNVPTDSQIEGTDISGGA
ncbi:hypothetical protein SEMRO_1404_G269730.1 [Seminavis robusta]|uniref:Uncharacterized protein n=1 Tax=Seminavis robusta TaxID=568900 RepID=A0A9N8ELB3_9STRA|nr:hypothetical protein SEMRO_1404_G269730.1 [Seminavis robusta]|eukprot:Sro1404_g269730.1 n/a (92) ;mRNA; r:23048-23323